MNLVTKQLRNVAIRYKTAFDSSGPIFPLLPSVLASSPSKYEFSAAEKLRHIAVRACFFLLFAV